MRLRKHAKMANRAMPFDLLGGIERHPDKDLWRCEIVLRTPDGAETRLTSEYEYLSEAQADGNLRHKLDEILAQFRKDGVEVIAKNGVPCQ